MHRSGLQGEHGLIANAARGHIDHTQQAHFIGGVGHQAQEGDHILDLAPAIKALCPDQAVRDARVHQSFFDDAGLGVGAVHHGKVVGAGLAGFEVLGDGVHHKGRFGDVIHCHVLHDLVAAAALAEEVLGGAVAVAVDHLARAIQYVLR